MELTLCPEKVLLSDYFSNLTYLELYCSVGSTLVVGGVVVTTSSTHCLIAPPKLKHVYPEQHPFLLLHGAPPHCSLRRRWGDPTLVVSFLVGFVQPQSESCEQDAAGSFEHVPGSESVGALEGLADGDLLGLDVGVGVGETDGALEGLALGD